MKRSRETEVYWYYTVPFHTRKSRTPAPSVVSTPRLRCILNVIDLTTPTPESRAQAYIYAVLCSLCKSQAGAQHFWFGLRAATRIRSELTASICDKALKRKDFSGSVERDKKAGTRARTRAKARRGRARARRMKGERRSKPEPTVSVTVSASCFTHGALVRILASIILYKLLGLAAFPGFLVLLLGWPRNRTPEYLHPEAIVRR
ncbi:hypothetical protein DXG01_011788 [Tephrocybe rancida]|nr:hypothetical protein DXG01_011788 [Tephrocybe rancida]